MEEYRIIEGMNYYYVSDDGNVKSADRVVMTKGGWTQVFYGKVLKPCKNTKRNNYEQVRICENGIAKTYKVHQLVAKAFPEICGEWFEGCEIDHINGITTDNRAVNLRVTNKKGNMSNPITKERCTNAWTDERREAASRRMKENNPVKQSGYWTEERRKAVSNKLTGRKHTEESKAKMMGRHITEETRTKLITAATKRIRDNKGKFVCQ